MRSQQRIRRMALAGIALALLVGVLSGSPTSADPDYTQVNDILGGRQHLLRTDDLVIAYTAGGPKGALQLYSNSQITSASSTILVPDPGNTLSDPVVTAARMFNTPYDVAVTLVYHRPQQQLLWRLDTSAGTVASDTVFLTASLPDPNSFLSVVAGDFTGDGLDEFVVFLTAVGANGSAIVATAMDPNDPSKGLNFGPRLQFFGPPSTQLPNHLEPLKVTTATVLGQPRVVVAGPTDYLAQCPTRHSGLSFESYWIDPQSLALTSAGTWSANLPEGNNSCLYFVDITAGRFGNTAHDQLVVAYAVEGGNVKILPFDIAQDGSAVQRTVYDTQQPVGTGRFWIKSGRFDWSNPFDQAALTISAGLSSVMNTLRILTFDQNLNVQSGPVVQGSGCIGDVAVGNFDQMQQNPLPPPAPAMIRNPNLQLAVFLQDVCGGGGQGMGVQIFDVNPSPQSGYQLAGHSVYFNGEPGAVQPQSMSIAAGDFDPQGRSYRLGNGTKITIEDYTQPSAITAMPPMHVDFVIPSGGTAPTVLNLSAVPDTFNTQYVIESVNNTDTIKTDTVSHSFGFKETLGGSLTVGDYDEGEGFKVQDTVTATQDIKNYSDAEHGVFESRGETVAIQTRWGDQVFYTTSIFNIWVYEVLGQKVCPQGKPNCQDSDKRPLTVQFSAPSETQDRSAAGPLIEWYQPPWEPGNVFSYPANYAQLQQSVQGAIDKLTQDQSYLTDSTRVTQTTQWRSGVSSSSTIGTDKTFSGDNNLSVAGKWKFGTVGGFGIKASFEASGSDAFSNNTQTKGEANQSTGITFTKPGTFAEQSLYAYGFTPYIFGTMQPPNFVDTVALNTQVTTFGPLRSAFVADPTAPGSGGWWSQTYTVPDVALNHPARWTLSRSQLPTPPDPIPRNCLSFDPSSSDMDCMTLSQATPNNPWSSAVHFMRGFFISSALKPGAGPQRTMAVEGERLALQARVYNYSLAPMSDDTTVHVRFYGVPWNQSTQMPVGNAFLIGEDVLGPIPAFDASPNNETPNWLLASTTWDTSNLGDQYFTFFVLAWMQQDSSSGPKLGAEMLGHGLKCTPDPVPNCNPPGTLNSFSDAAQLEEIVSGQTVSYSNNLGFYNHVFSVIPQDSSELTTLTQHAPGDVRLGPIKLSQSKVAAGQSLEVATLLRTQKQSASGVSVVFYDGDPQHGGTVFDVERIAHIRAHDTAEARVLFRSNVCGEHRIYVTVGQGKPYEVTDASRPFQVQCAQPKRMSGKGK